MDATKVLKSPARNWRSCSRCFIGLFTFTLISQVSLVQAAPKFEIPEGTYRWTENWRYKKTHSSQDTIVVKKDKKQRVIFASRKQGIPATVYFPDGSFVRHLSEGPGLWLGEWTLNNGDLKMKASAGRHSAAALMKRKSRTEWTWTGYHSFDGKRIGTGWGKLAKIK